MLVTLCSDKGSPGATTAAIALAAAWAKPAVVVEADPDGGDLGIRMRTSRGATLPEAPTVVTLATAARSNQDPDVIGRFSHQINEQITVVPGHLASEHMASLRDWTPLAQVLQRSSSPVLADIGRAHTSSPLLSVAAAADRLVIVARADVGSIIRLRERLSRLVPAIAALRGGPLTVCPLVVSPARHGVADAQDVTRLLRESQVGALVSSVGFLALDAGAVRRLEAGENPRGRLARTPLLRSASAFARQLRGEERVAAVVGVTG